MGIILVVLAIFFVSNIWGSELQNQTYYIYVKEMSDVLLTCTTEENSTLWFGPGRLEPYAIDNNINPNVKQRERLQISTHEMPFRINLQINNFTKEDEGFYYCTSEGQKEYAQAYEVKIQEDPTHLVIQNEHENNFIYGFVNKVLVLNCTVTQGTPVGTIEWRSDNKTIVIENNDTVTYSFSPVLDDHFKNLTCIAKNKFTQIPLKRTVKLFLYLPLQVEIEHKNTNINEGNNLTLNCNFESNHDITGLKWTFLSVMGDNKNDISTNESMLILYNIVRSQSGEYQCIVKNQAGEGKDGVLVTVQYAPVVDVEFNRLQKTFKCFADGVPDHFTFFNWEHKSHYHEHIRSLKGDGNGTLTIDDVVGETDRHHDSGIYVCSVSNGIPLMGNDIMTAEYIRKESGTPYFVSSNNDTHYGSIGESKQLSFCVVSEPSLTSKCLLTKGHDLVNVSFDENFVKTCDIVYGKNITVRVLQISFHLHPNDEKDFKQYTIVVTNDYGSRNYSFNLKAAGPPQTPIILRSVSKNTEIKVFWKPKFNGGYKQSFFMRYKKKYCGGQWQTVSTGTKNITLLRKLESDTKYIIQMVAENSVGKSNFTDEFIVKTEKRRKTKPEYIVLSVVLILLIVLSAFGYFHFRKETELKKSIVSCFKPRRAANVPDNEAVGGVENNIYDFGNNVVPPVNIHDVPVYSSIDRRTNVGVDAVMTYAVSKKPGIVKIDQTGTEANDSIDMRRESKDRRQRSINKSSNLNYIEICFDEKPKDYKFIIRGRGNKTPYADIDFTQSAPCLSSSEEEQDSDDDFMDIDDVQMMKRPPECENND